MSLRLVDYRDLDLLMVMEEQGALTSAELAEVLGMKEDVRNVAIRSAWMKRYGAFSFNEKLKLWSLTPSAERIVEAHKRAGRKSEIESVPDEALIDSMAHITSRYRLGDPTTAALLRREFLFGTANRNGVRPRN